MHADEITEDGDLGRRLLAGQFPEWAGLPLEPVPSGGTDNALYRLGTDMVVRLPRIHWATGGVEKDSRWLSTLAPLLPVEVPVPLAKGAPAEGYPWSGVGVGDPACDLIVAWGLFRAEARNVIRNELDVDEATWARGRGWALSVGLIALPYYVDTNPMLAATARHLIHEVLSDERCTS